MAEGKITITLKGGNDFQEPWIVIGGDTVEEVIANLNGLQGVLGEVSEYASLFHAARTVTVTPAVTTAPPTAVAPGVQQAAAPVATAPSAPRADALFCPHGQRTKRSGTGANGRWTAHFCALAKGHPDACKPIWE